MLNTKIGCVFWGILLLAPNVFADTQSAYESAQAYITNHHFSEKLNASVQQAKKRLPPAPAHPSQEHYYTNPNAIKQDAMTSVSDSNTLGHVVRHDAFTRPKMSVNEDSPEIQFSHKVQDHAQGIADGTYKDCHQKTIDDITYTTKTCSTGLPFAFDCIKTLNVTIKKEQVTKDDRMSIAGHAHFNFSSTGTLAMPEEKGVVTQLSMHVRDGSNPWSCFQTYSLRVNGVNIGSYQGSCGKYLGDLQFSRGNLKIAFSNHTLTLTLIGGRLSGYPSGVVSFSYPAEEKKAIQTWDSSCASIPNSCNIHNTLCLEKGSTKTFDGVPVSAHCWKENVAYQCGSPMSAACKALEESGCTQVSSQCAEQDAGSCARYDEKWSCPNKKTIVTGIQCGERFYCMDGSCQATHTETNKDFGQSVTELDAVASAGEDVKKHGSNPNTDPNAIRIFTGHAAQCREVVLGALNCCADRGWAKGIFANCNDEEKSLGHAKEQGGLVIDVGRYCSAEVLGVCTEHKEGYCIFPSRIAYDIQKYGRFKQLGKGFGSGKNPDCSGLSPQEIATLHFDRIDFSNVIHSVTNGAHWPSGSQSEKNIEKEIQDAIARKRHD